MEKILILVDLVIVMGWTLNRRGKKGSKKKNSRKIQAIGLKKERVFVLLHFCLIEFFTLWGFFEK